MKNKEIIIILSTLLIICSSATIFGYFYNEKNNKQIKNALEKIDTNNENINTNNKNNIEINNKNNRKICSMFSYDIYEEEIDSKYKVSLYKGDDLIKEYDDSRVSCIQESNHYIINKSNESILYDLNSYKQVISFQNETINYANGKYITVKNESDTYKIVDYDGKILVDYGKYDDILELANNFFIASSGEELYSCYDYNSKKLLDDSFEDMSKSNNYIFGLSEDKFKMYDNNYNLVTNIDIPESITCSLGSSEHINDIDDLFISCTKYENEKEIDYAIETDIFGNEISLHKIESIEEECEEDECESNDNDWNQYLIYTNKSINNISDLDFTDKKEDSDIIKLVDGGIKIKGYNYKNKTLKISNIKSISLIGDCGGTGIIYYLTNDNILYGIYGFNPKESNAKKIAENVEAISKIDSIFDYTSCSYTTLIFKDLNGNYSSVDYDEDLKKYIIKDVNYIDNVIDAGYHTQFFLSDEKEITNNGRIFYLKDNNGEIYTSIAGIINDKILYLLSDNNNLYGYKLSSISEDNLKAEYVSPSKIKSYKIEDIPQEDYEEDDADYEEDVCNDDEDCDDGYEQEDDKKMTIILENGKEIITYGTILIK